MSATKSSSASILTSRPDAAIPSTAGAVDAVAATLALPPDRVGLLADLRTGRLPARPRVTALRRVIHDAVEHAAERARGHLFTSRCPEDSVADVDADLLRVALTEVLDNAVTHGPPGTHAHIDVVMSEDGVEIAIADDGPGIPASMLGLVAQATGHPAVVADRSPISEGIGLLLTSQVLRVHGFQLQIQSTTRGTLVRLFLPASAPIVERKGQS